MAPLFGAFGVVASIWSDGVAPRLTLPMSMLLQLLLMLLLLMLLLPRRRRSDAAAEQPQPQTSRLVNDDRDSNSWHHEKP